MKTAIFLERDGILNLARSEGDEQIAPLTLEQFKINEKAIVPLRLLRSAGVLLIATTNQPGMSEGNLSRWDLDRMHQMLQLTFSLDDIFVCPHSVDDFCPCRKPSSGLFTEAAFKHNLDLEHSFVISDKWQDAEAARVIGATSLLVDSPWIGDGHHDFVLPDFSTVVKKIVQLKRSQIANCA